jgi:hypothetical protein
MGVRRVGISDGYEAEDVGSGVRLLHYGEIIRVEHECDRWDDEEEPDGVFVKVVAPALTTEGPVVHVIHARTPTTITPSILCKGCGLHGYVTNGEWRNA